MACLYAYRIGHLLQVLQMVDQCSTLQQHDNHHHHTLPLSVDLMSITSDSDSDNDEDNHTQRWSHDYCIDRNIHDRGIISTVI